MLFMLKISLCKGKAIWNAGSVANNLDGFPLLNMTSRAFCARQARERAGKSVRKMAQSIAVTTEDVVHNGST